MRSPTTGRRRPRRCAAAAVVALFAAAALAACTADGSRPAARVSTTGYPTSGPGTATQLDTASWTQLPAAPIPGRSRAAAVWTGRQMVVWGGARGYQGSELRADGAAYDPAARRWTLVPRAPLSPRADVASVWTGREMFVWGGYDHVMVNPHAVDALAQFHAAADGARYDPVKGTWRRLPPAPLQPRVRATAVWTGHEVIVVGGTPAAATDKPYLDAAAYDPATDHWRRLADAPRPHGTSNKPMTVVAAGSHIFAVLPWRETHRINSNTWTGNAGIDLLRYDIPTDRWTVLRDAGQHVQGLDGAVWTGRELITTAAPRICVASCPWTPALPGQRYDPATGGWTPLPRGPVDDLRPHTLWTGAALLAFDTGTYTSGPNGTTYAGAAAVWDPHANRWTRLAGAPYASVGNAAAVWASDRLLEWGEMTMPRDRRGGTSTVGLSYG